MPKLSDFLAASTLALFASAALGQDVFGNGTVVSYTVPGTYYYRVPLNVYKIRVRVVGAGGSGAAAGGPLAAATGGAAGGVGWKVISVTPGDVYAITVGKGGTSVTCVYNQAFSGVAGGASSFGALVTANGGAGGTASLAVGTVTGAVGGTVVGADYSVQGGPSGDAIIQAAATAARAVTGGGALLGYKSGIASAAATASAGTGGAGTGGASGDATATGTGNALTAGGGSGSPSLPITVSSGTTIGTPGGNLSGGTGEDTTVYTFTARHMLDNAFRGSASKIISSPTVGVYTGGGGFASTTVNPSAYNLSGGIGAGGGAFAGNNTSLTGTGGNGGTGAGGGGATIGNGGAGSSGAGGDGCVIVEA